MITANSLITDTQFINESFIDKINLTFSQRSVLSSPNMFSVKHLIESALFLKPPTGNFITQIHINMNLLIRKYLPSKLNY